MLKFNLFVILTFLSCNAQVINLGIPEVITNESKVFVDKITDENAFADTIESLFSTVRNSTGSEEDEEEGSKDECAGGLLDFIQCVVHTKIDTFKKELGKKPFPEKPLRDFQLRRIDSKIQSSLENWLQKFVKDFEVTKDNCTCAN